MVKMVRMKWNGTLKSLLVVPEIKKYGFSSYLEYIIFKIKFFWCTSRVGQHPFFFSFFFSISPSRNNMSARPYDSKTFVSVQIIPSVDIYLISLLFYVNTNIFCIWYICDWCLIHPGFNIIDCTYPAIPLNLNLWQ